MTYRELFNKTKEKYNLEDEKIRYLLKFYLKVTELDEINIKSDELSSFFSKAKEAKSGKPVQYIVGNVDFYGYLFFVEPGVLIPRFETEQLIYHTIKYVNKFFNGKVHLIDIGTGTGAIGITLKKELPNLEVTLTDISPKALKLAKRNAINLDAKVEIHKSDMLNKVIAKGQKYDVLVSNPPYLSEDEEVMEVVKKYEPHTALFGGLKGLDYYEKILSNAKRILNNKALIGFEIGADQAEDIILIAKKYFEDSPFEIIKDFEGRNRMFFLFYNLDD